MKKIQLTKGQESIVDDQDYEHLSGRKWFASKTRSDFYAGHSLYINPRKSKIMFLHWYIVGRPLSGFMVDHINGDTLDNRRSNLRIVTQRQNSQNFRKHREGKLPGISWYKNDSKWVARMKINGKDKYLGSYDNKFEAHSSYLKAQAAAQAAAQQPLHAA